MRKYFDFNILILLSAGLITASGCAKQGTVAKDEVIPVAAPAKPVEAAPVQNVVADKGIKDQPVKEVPVKDTAADTAKNSASSAAPSPKLSLEKVYFDFDSHTLSPAARDALADNGRLLGTNNGVKVRIEGHCDDRGSDEYNLALGEKRARAAFNYLTAMGIPAENLSVISYGKEKPAVTGNDEAAWAKNRRDEFIVLSK